MRTAALDTNRITAPRAIRPRRGFSLIEMLIAIVVLGILAVIVAPRVSSVTTRAKVNEAIGVVAADLEQSVQIAARLRRPVVLRYVSGTTYSVRDRATSPGDTLRLSRDLALSGHQGASTVAFSPTSVTIFPNGLVSAALQVTLTSNGYSRQASMTPTGLVRIQ